MTQSWVTCFKIDRFGAECLKRQAPKSTVGGCPGPKIAHFCKKWQFLLFVGSDFLLEIEFLAIFGQYSFQQCFLALGGTVLHNESALHPAAAGDMAHTNTYVIEGALSTR